MTVSERKFMTPRPQPTPKHLAVWRRLLTEARACANNPARPTGDLFARATAAVKAVFPTGAAERANPWCMLLDAAIVFCAKRAERETLAPGLAAKAEACAAMLVEDLAPRRRFRADVDG